MDLRTSTWARKVKGPSSIGRGGPKWLHARNESLCLPSCDTRRRCVAAPQGLPNERHSLVSVLDNVKHVEGVHLWHLLINELHMEDFIAVSREARAVGLNVICYVGVHGVQR